MNCFDKNLIWIAQDDFDLACFDDNSFCNNANQLAALADLALLNHRLRRGCESERGPLLVAKVGSFSMVIDTGGSAGQTILRFSVG